MKVYPIDFIRQVFEQTLLEEHIKNPNKYYGGKDQVCLFSFYEQLQKEDEVNRYVEVYRDLVDQQNRMGLIMNGTIVAPENPTITNINSALIIPMAFTCNFRIKLANRDMALETINNMFDIIKGRKRDIAMFSDGKLFMVGTIANEIFGNPTTKSGDYIGEQGNNESIGEMITRISTSLTTNNITLITTNGTYYYFTNKYNKLSVLYRNNGSWEEITDSGEYENIIFPPSETTFTKFKMSLSFDALRCDEPRTLNSEDYCTISFGGSATLVSNGVKLGNDLTKVSIKRTKIAANPDITISDTATWLEPLELPSGNNPNVFPIQLKSNNFVNNSHTDGITISLQYTFIVDETIALLKQFFDYARYGIQANGSTITYTQGITPNMIYEVCEIWSSWGVIDKKVVKTKIAEAIEIENSESDTLTMTIPMQVQGDNQ